MKKIISVFVVLLVVFYLVYEHGSSWILALLSTTSGKGSKVMALGSSNGTSQTFKDGTYTGNAADAYYGNIQVKATITNGKITDVQFLDYPQHATRSIAINTLAMPNLKQEAIQAQSAHVDIVSGATDSSNAFMVSLASALDQAK